MANDLHFGVSVGIDHYPDLSPLKFARKDATEFADWLRNPQGGDLPTENVELVTASDGEVTETTPREDAVPVRTAVYNAIRRYSKRAMQRVDSEPRDWIHTRLYVFVSGHGIGPSAQDVALLMANAGPEDYGENVSCRELVNYLGRAQYFAEVAVFADCCRDHSTNAPLGKPPWTLVDRDFGEVNTVLGVAADFRGKAYEPDNQGSIDPDEYRGYYSRALLEALHGRAADENGEVSTQSLAAYIERRLKQLLEDTGKIQKCHLYSDLNAPIVLVRDATSMLPLTITFETDFRGVAVLFNGSMEEVSRQQIVGAGTHWQVSLVKGLYRVVPDGGSANVFKGRGYFEVFGGNDVVL